MFEIDACAPRPSGSRQAPDRRHSVHHRGPVIHDSLRLGEGKVHTFSPGGGNALPAPRVARTAVLMVDDDVSEAAASFDRVVSSYRSHSG